MQLMNNKNTVRWEKILGTAVVTFQDQFIDVALRSLMSSSNNINNILASININVGSSNSNTSPNTSTSTNTATNLLASRSPKNILENLENLSNLLKITIHYQEFDKG